MTADALSMSRVEARTGIESLSTGVPPSRSITDVISVGLDQDLDVFTEEYFGPDGLLRNADQGTFKLVEAYYGGGKTHYLRAVERLAHRYGFASAFVELSKDACPVSRFDLLYHAIMTRITLPADGGGREAQGIGDVIRTWITPPEGTDALEHADEQVSKVGDLPLPSMRIALRNAAHAAAAQDRSTLDELLVYLQSGKIAPAIRKRGIMETIDARNGLLAIRSLANWLRQISVPGLVLVLDEGDRSLSLASTKEQTAASNNLVQLINEVVNGADWPGVMFLYSIPSWSDFDRVFGHNQALIQRVQRTGFPDVPPAPRIVLDSRYSDERAKIEFCAEVGRRIALLFELAYGGEAGEENALRLARRVAEKVVVSVVDVSFRRHFIQSYIKALYKARGGQALSDIDIEDCVRAEV